MTARLRVVHVRPGQLPTVTEVPASWPALEQLVGGGDLDVVALAADVQLWVNDEGDLFGLAPNRTVPDVGLVHGPFFLTGRDPDGELRSLSTRRAHQLAALAERWTMAGAVVC